MQWLLHGNLTPAVDAALKRHEQKTHALTELELAPDAGVAEILSAAKKKQWDILTADPAFATVPFEAGLTFARSIVFLQLEGGDVEQDDAVDRLFDRYKRLSPGRLYTVTGTRVKVRQLPTLSGGF